MSANRFVSFSVNSRETENISPTFNPSIAFFRMFIIQFSLIVKNEIFGYRDYERNYLGSVIKEKQLFPLKEEIDDGTYLADKYIPRMLFSFNKVVLTELLQKVEVEEVGDSEEIMKI